MLFNFEGSGKQSRKPVQIEQWANNLPLPGSPLKKALWLCGKKLQCQHTLPVTVRHLKVLARPSLRASCFWWSSILQLILALMRESPAPAQTEGCVQAVVWQIRSPPSIPVMVPPGRGKQNYIFSYLKSLWEMCWNPHHNFYPQTMDRLFAPNYSLLICRTGFYLIPSKGCCWWLKEILYMRQFGPATQVFSNYLLSSYVPNPYYSLFLKHIPQVPDQTALNLGAAQNFIFNMLPIPLRKDH